MLVILFLTPSVKGLAKGGAEGEEITIEINHRIIGSDIIPAFLSGEQVYVKPSDIFNFVKVHNELSSDGRSITGHYIDEEAKYNIDFQNAQIRYRDDIYKLKPDEYVILASGYYLRSDIFEKIFQLKCLFTFNGLSISLSSGKPLPAEIEISDAAKRNNMQQAASEVIPDKRFGLPRSLFSLGTVDWSAGGGYSKFLGAPTNSGISTDGVKSYQYNFLLGGQILGGDFDASLTQSNYQPIDWKNTPFRWRMGIPNSSLISQIMIGRHSFFSNIQLADSMVGIQVTNAYSGYRSSYSNYTISDHTEPNWTVELYVNNALISYTKADQTGFYKFVIPLSYGSTNVQLRFRGPYGEVRISTIDLRIPYTFLPPGNFEYTLTGGTSLAHPSLNSSTGTLDGKLGISTAMTLSGGVNYSKDDLGKLVLLPYGTTSFRATSGILLGGEYYYKTGFRSSLDIAGPTGFSLDANVDHPFTANPVSAGGFTILDQRRVLLLMPMPFIGGDFHVTALDIPISKDSGNFSLSPQLTKSFFGLTLNASSTLNFIRDRFHLYPGSYNIGNAGISGSTFANILFRTSATVDLMSHRVTTVDLNLTKPIFETGTVSVTGTYSFLDGSTRIQADLRMNLPFAQVGTSSTWGTNMPLATNASMAGSLTFDPVDPRFLSTYRPQVRRGGLEIVPFIDQNGNGKYDEGEPLVKHFGLEQPPGGVYEQDNGILRIFDLEPYRKYVVKTTAENTDNIALISKFQTFEFTPPANGFVRVEIPLSVAGQIEGYVYLAGATDEPLGGARIKIQNRDSQDTSEVRLSEDLLSYSSGEFFYLGLVPGKYRAYIDPKQLQLLHYSCNPPYIDFELKSKEEGDIVEGLNFTVKQDFGPSTAAKKDAR